MSRIALALFSWFALALPCAALDNFDKAMTEQHFVALGNIYDYCPLSEAVSSTTITCLITGNTMTVGSGVTMGAGPFVAGTAETAASFGGSGTGNWVWSSDTGYNVDTSTSWMAHVVVAPNVLRSGGATSYQLFGKNNPATPFEGYSCNLTWTSPHTNIQCIITHSFTGNTYYQATASTTDITNVSSGTGHDIIVIWYGSTAGGFDMWVDGVKQAITVNHNTLSTNNSTTANAVFALGARLNATQTVQAQPLNGSIQKFAFYNHISQPNFSGLEAAFDYDLMANSASLTSLNALLPSSGLQLIHDNDSGTDVDNYASQLLMNRYQLSGKANVIANIACDSVPQDPSGDYAGFAFFGLGSTFMGTYQGTDLNTTDFWAAGTTTTFQSRFNTEVGLVTAPTVSAGGTNYVAGDILTIPNGTVDRAPTQLIIPASSLTAGVITGALQIYDSGNYSTPPTSPQTLTGGSGSGAIVTFAYPTNTSGSAANSNWPSDTVAYRRALHAANNGKVVIVVGGSMACINDLITSPADGIDTGTGAALMQAKVAAIIVAAGYAPSTAYWGAGCDYNLCYNTAGAIRTRFISAAQSMITNMPAGIPVILEGIEQTPGTGNYARLAVGPQPVTGASATNPFINAYHLSSAQTWRNAWDDYGVWLGVNNLGADTGIVRPGMIAGTLAIDASGNVTTTPATAGQYYYIQTLQQFNVCSGQVSSTTLTMNGGASCVSRLSPGSTVFVHAFSAPGTAIVGSGCTATASTTCPVNVTQTWGSNQTFANSLNVGDGSTLLSAHLLQLEWPEGQARTGGAQ